MSVSRTSKSRLGHAEAQAMAVRLRIAGLTLREIGEQIGRSVTTVHRMIIKALDDYGVETCEAVAELRNVEGARLERLHRAVWTKAVAGNLSSVDRAIRISEARCKLYGLYAPQKIAPTDPSGNAEFVGGGLSALLNEIREHGNSGDPA